MTSAYSPILKTELPALGDQAGTWSTTNNNNIGTILEHAIAGRVSVSLAGVATYTLTNVDGALTNEATYAAIALTGTPSGACSVICPNASKGYWVYNGTSGGLAITFKTAAGAGVAIPAGKYLFLLCTGTDVVDPAGASTNALTAPGATLAGPLSVTGTTAVPTSSVAGEAVNNTRLSAFFPAGLISLWSGAIAAIPAGWALCDGTSGTPDLRDRFIVGAGSTYAVAATGGEATHTLTTAEMPVHSHANTLTDPGHFHTIQPSTQGSGGSAGSQGAFWTGANTSTNTTGITITNVNAGSGDAHENRPPYYALAYVMKL
jgi:microcystin-dependent protein